MWSRSVVFLNHLCDNKFCWFVNPLYRFPNFCILLDSALIVHVILRESSFFFRKIWHNLLGQTYVKYNLTTYSYSYLIHTYLHKHWKMLQKVTLIAKSAYQLLIAFPIFRGILKVQKYFWRRCSQLGKILVCSFWPNIKSLCHV